jgi:UDP-glucose 4-epimerase
MKKILITGGAGFIGSMLAEKLAEIKKNEVVIVDNLLTGHLLKLPTAAPNIRFIKADVNNRSEIAEIMMAYRFDYVFHYAAVVGVEMTIKNPVLVLNDLSGLRNIVELSKNTGVKRIYYSSSSEIYGEPVEFPQHEDTTPLNSRLPYAIVKNAGEAFLKSYHREFGLEHTIFRFFNTYGHKQSRHFVISRFMSMALTGKDITIYGDGMQTRTFCYIDDNITATVNAFYRNEFVNEVVNIGDDNETSVKDLAVLIKKITGSSSKIIHLPPLAEGDMRGRRPDTRKMDTLIDKPRTGLEEGIKKVMKLGLMELKLHPDD